MVINLVIYNLLMIVFNSFLIISNYVIPLNYKFVLKFKSVFGKIYFYLDKT